MIRLFVRARNCLPDLIATRLARKVPAGRSRKDPEIILQELYKLIVFSDLIIPLEKDKYFKNLESSGEFQKSETKHI